MMGQETRNKLTDYWKDNGIEKPDEAPGAASLVVDSLVISIDNPSEDHT